MRYDELMITIKNTSLAFVLMLAGVGISSCKKGAGKADASSSDSTTLVSSDSTLLPIAASEAEFRSTDLQSLNLRGPVKSVEQSSTPESFAYHYGFDRSGRLTTMFGMTADGPILAHYQYDDATSFKGHFVEQPDMYTRIVLERDKSGRIIILPTLSFTWADGFHLQEYIEGGWEDATTYTPQQTDDKGNILRDTFLGVGEGQQWSGHNTYRYNTFDEYGNWTERTQTQVVSEYEFEGEPGQYETHVITTTRHIEYYE